MPWALRVAGLAGPQDAKMETGVQYSEPCVHQRRGLEPRSRWRAEAQVEQLHHLASVQGGRWGNPPQRVLVESQEFLKDGRAGRSVQRRVGLRLVKDLGAGGIEIPSQIEIGDRVEAWCLGQTAPAQGAERTGQRRQARRRG